VIKIKKVELDKLKISNIKIKRILLAVIISLLIEIFICNFPAFRTMFTNKNIEKDFVLDEKTIIISNIDERITSININYKNELTDKVTYKIKYVAEDTSDTVWLRDKVVLENQKQYVHFDTHAKCKTLQIDLETWSEIHIENIVLNHVNFNINIYRIFMCFLVNIFIIKIKDKSLFKVKYNCNSERQKYIFLLNLTIICMFIYIYIICQYNCYSLSVKPEEINKEDSILMQTEAFANGSIKLLEEPTEELKNMENPYDHVARSNNNVSYLYDVAYYNGAYYNYFGVAPIITLILPFRLLTGMYLHTYIFNFIFIFGMVLVLYSLYKKLVDKYIKNITLCHFYLGYYAMLFGSNIFTLLRGAKYDIVVTSGIMFLLIAMNLAMSVYKNEKFKYLKLILLGISTALIVLSKPNLIIYYPLILFLLLTSMKELKIKDKIKDSIFVMVPLGIFAIFQMILNYLRFDNILEFGAKYQLTSFNMISCMGITFGKAFAGIMEYVFRTPMINPLKFPFVFINKDTNLVTINEICYENRLVGLIAIAILWVYLFKKNILKKEQTNELRNFINVGIIVSIIAIIVTTCFGGICEAYSIDFKVILCVGAAILLLKLVEQNEGNENINKIFIFLCLITISLMIPISFTTETTFLENLTSSVTVFLKNIFEFWI